MTAEGEILSVFDEVLASVDNSLVKKAMHEGRIPIGYTCSHVPEVLLSVGKLFPLRLRAPGITGTQSADAYLPPTVCTYCRSLLEFGMDGRYDFLGGWVFNFSCQHMNRCYDTVRHTVKPSFVYILDALHSVTDSATSWMADEFRDLAVALSSHFGVAINQKTLSLAIKEHNKSLIPMREIAESRKEDSPPVTGTEFHKLMMAWLAAPKNELAERIEQFRESIRMRESVNGCRARLMVLGGSVDDPRFIEMIEKTGGLVVADRFCTGSLPQLERISEGPDDPFERIAEYTIARPCPRMINTFERGLEDVLDAIGEYRVDGVIVQQLKFCDPMNYYGKAMRDSLREKGIPVLRLDREYMPSGEGQIRTRVQAFLESMGK